jgi:hypothetical protein
MHTSLILQEAINYFFDNDKLELSIVLLSIAIERLMKQHLFETDEILVLDKNNSIEHLARFRRLYSKISKESYRQKIEALKEKRENFKTITFDELIKRYDAFFDLPEERIKALRRLENLRNNVVHFHDYYLNVIDESLFILTEIIPFIREIIAEVKDNQKFEDILSEEIIEKLQKRESELTELQKDELNQKIEIKKQEYNELHQEEIEVRKQNRIRDTYEDREIFKEQLNCPACNNNSFHILKLFDEEREEPTFFYKGICLICELELTEDELKTLNITYLK